jgi:predicted helicase
MTISQFEQSLGLQYVTCDQYDDLEIDDDTIFTEKHLLDYIYAVLHHRGYRDRYSEFLKIDFPRVPVISDVSVFYQLCDYGQQLRKLHLMTDITPQ